DLIRKFWVDWDGGSYTEVRSNPLQLAPQLAIMLVYPLSILFRVLILVAIVLARSRRVWIALIICGIVVLALLMQKGVALHYYAPTAGLLIFLIVTGWRHVLRMASAKSVALRRITSAALAGVFILTFVYDITDAVRHPASHAFATHRQEIIAR